MNCFQIDRIKTLLDEVNGMIETMLLYTRDDIKKVLVMLKKIEGKREYQATVESIVEHLQSFDIFEQRMRHIIDINCRVPVGRFYSDEDMAPGNGPSIFRLNQFQFECAWSDYMKAVTYLEKAIQSGDKKATVSVDFASTGILSKAVVHVTSDKFSKAMELTSAWGPGGLERYEHAVQNIYSSDRERVILSMLKSNPAVTMIDISIGLMESENRSSSIDLF